MHVLIVLAQTSRAHVMIRLNVWQTTAIFDATIEFIDHTTLVEETFLLVPLVSPSISHMCPTIRENKTDYIHRTFLKNKIKLKDEFQRNFVLKKLFFEKENFFFSKIVFFKQFFFFENVSFKKNVFSEKKHFFNFFYFFHFLFYSKAAVSYRNTKYWFENIYFHF